VRALGTNAKVTGSLGDLKAEKVLPRRHESATAYSEKLRQVCQILCVLSTDMMVSLDLSYEARAAYDAHQSPEWPRADTGLPFFQPDILTAASAADAEPDDPTPLQDVTPERFSKLEKELVRGKGKVVSSVYLVLIRITNCKLTVETAKSTW
jgi:protein regulator of cytokinesis 1